MTRWMKAICLIAAINEMMNIPPYVPGAVNVIRGASFLFACVLAYGAVTERGQE